MMLDRQWVGDVGLAILLALPTAALSRPQPPAPATAAMASIADKAAIAEASTTERRFSVEG